MWSRMRILNVILVLSIYSSCTLAQEEDCRISISRNSWIPFYTHGEPLELWFWTDNEDFRIDIKLNARSRDTYSFDIGERRKWHTFSILPEDDSHVRLSVPESELDLVVDNALPNSVWVRCRKPVLWTRCNPTFFNDGDETTDAPDEEITADEFPEEESATTEFPEDAEDSEVEDTEVEGEVVEEDVLEEEDLEEGLEEEGLEEEVLEEEVLEEVSEEEVLEEEVLEEEVLEEEVLEEEVLEEELLEEEVLEEEVLEEEDLEEEIMDEDLEEEIMDEDLEEEILDEEGLEEENVEEEVLEEEILEEEVLEEEVLDEEVLDEEVLDEEFLDEEEEFLDEEYPDEEVLDEEFADGELQDETQAEEVLEEEMPMEEVSEEPTEAEEGELEIIDEDEIISEEGEVVTDSTEELIAEEDITTAHDYSTHWIHGLDVIDPLLTTTTMEPPTDEPETFEEEEESELEDVEPTMHWIHKLEVIDPPEIFDDDSNIELADNSEPHSENESETEHDNESELEIEGNDIETTEIETSNLEVDRGVNSHPNIPPSQRIILKNNAAKYQEGMDPTILFYLVIILSMLLAIGLLVIAALAYFAVDTKKKYTHLLEERAIELHLNPAPMSLLEPSKSSPPYSALPAHAASRTRMNPYNGHNKREMRQPPSRVR